MRIGINPARGTKVENDDVYHRIVIPVYIPSLDDYFKDSFAILKLCLNSLYNTIHDKTKISIVSNGSCKEVNRFLADELAELRIDELYQLNAGIGKINSLFKIVNSVKEPLVTFADADVLFTTGWQSAVEQIMIDYPKVGMVCPFSYSKGFRQLTANVYFDNFFNSKIKITEIKDPDALKHFAKSIGNDDFYNKVQMKYAISYQEKGKSRALVGAGHFVATFKKEIFPPFAFNAELRRMASGERKYIDTPAVASGLWRFSTDNNYVYHMGNTIIPMYQKILEENKNDVPKEFPVKFNIKRQSSFIYSLKNKYFARIIFSNKVFVYLLKRFGLNRKEAKSFLN